MRRVVAGASIMLSILIAQGVRAADLKTDPQHRKTGNSQSLENSRQITIRVADGDWGDAKPEEIETLLYAVADKLLRHFPQRQLNPIVVSPTDRGPIVLFQKGPENEYQVHLAAKGKKCWDEFIYEFSHELFHILANYENHAPPKITSHLWFEETLCEAVSLYTLKQLAATWQQSPPRAEWAAYAPALKRFTGRVQNDPRRQLPPNTSLAQWFQENGPLLLENPYLRGKNELVANLFLPILEHTQDWQAVGFLNPDAPQKQETNIGFYAYLADWHNRTPPEHQEFTRLAMRMFHFDAPELVQQKLSRNGMQALVLVQPGTAQSPQKPAFPGAS